MSFAGDRPFISFVIPVYNAARYLRDAVLSILAQTAGGYEILLVNDGSHDSSGDLCNQLSAEYPFITAIHHDGNRGLGNARNTGMDAARGEYIMFMDADDTISRDLLRAVIDVLAEHPAPITLFGVEEVYFSNKDAPSFSRIVTMDTPMSLSERRAIRELVIKLEETTLFGYAWNKVYAVDYLRNAGTRFGSEAFIEDVMFNVSAFENIHALNILSGAFYRYNRRVESGLTGTYRSDYWALHRMRVETIRRQYERWDMCTPAVKRRLGNLYVRYVFSALSRNCDRRADMRHADRRAFLELIFDDETYKALISYANASNVLVSTMIRILRGKHVFSAMSIARGIYLVKMRFPIAFARIKKKR